MNSDTKIWKNTEDNTKTGIKEYMFTDECKRNAGRMSYSFLFQGHIFVFNTKLVAKK